MSEKPQAAWEEGREDLLEQIISQGLDRMAAQATAPEGKDPPPEKAPPAPEGENADGAAPADGKRRRSAVYLYLLVLFGAAFLMLLLAYFVQRRSSEDTISSLRDSMNLSRTELLDQISALEAQNGELKERVSEQRGELSTVYVERAQWQRLYEEAALESSDFYDQLSAAREAMYSWAAFWELERHYQAEDYESCAAVLILQGQSQYTYHTPESARERYDEILQAVIGAGLLVEDYYRYPDRYNDLLDTYFNNVSGSSESDAQPDYGPNSWANFALG